MAFSKRFVLLLLVGVGALLAPIGRTEAAGPAPGEDQGGYSYFYQGQLITLTASSDLIALVEAAPGSADAFAATRSWRRDPVSERPALKSRGLVLYRLRRPEGKSTAVASAAPALDAAVRAGLTAQPVFELGGALKIPFDEVTLGFLRDTTMQEAKEVLDREAADQGIVEVRPLMKNTYVLKITNATNGRAFAVSRALARLPGVAYAEPNCAVHLFDQPAEPLVDFLNDPIPALEGDPLPLKAAGFSESAEPPAVTVVEGRDVPLADVGWTTILSAGFDGAAPGWGTMGAPVPIMTNYRVHSGSGSAYMTGGGTGGVAPPGPYPNNADAYLLSPTMDLSPYEEAYVELWFYAKHETPGASGLYDAGEVLLYNTGTGASQRANFLAVAYTGDLTLDPTTQGGWRRYLYRVPPAFRTSGVQLRIHFHSDSSVTAEGLYVDDILVVGTFDVDASAISNDTYSARQYELSNSGQIAGLGNGNNDLNAPEAWAVVATPSPVVAVIDSGVELNHPDLNLVGGFDAETGGPGGAPKVDGDNHGQACAGNVAAVRNNGVGVAGTAPGARIMPVYGGGTDASLALGIDLARVNGAKVLSNSWGWVGAPSAVIQTAVVNALAAGRVVLFAAGNGPDRSPYTYDTAFPCNLTASTAVICVGASSPTDGHKNASSSDGNFSWGSSYVGAGPDIVAPGPWSYTTDRQGAKGYNTDAAASGVDLNYTHAFGGTSSSTPKVAGIVALMLSVNPNLAPAQVKSILAATAKDIDTAGVDDRTGSGRVDALAALNACGPSVSIDDRPVTEGAVENASFRVVLSSAGAQPVTVSYATANGTAVGGSDFTPVSGTLTLTPGRTTHSIAVPILSDLVAEGTETFYVNLTSATGATIARSQAVGTIADPPASAVVPMYRAYNFGADYHFFTTSLGEKDNAVAHGYRDESTPIPFRVQNTLVPGAGALYRMYNPNNGRHYYTANGAERDSLKSVGWLYEKDEGFIYSAALSGRVELFRLYNNNSGVHLYTVNAGEKDAILATFPGIWFQHTSVGYAVP